MLSTVYPPRQGNNCCFSSQWMQYSGDLTLPPSPPLTPSTLINPYRAIIIIYLISSIAQMFIVYGNLWKVQN
ncbi:hypothetical protein J6590_061003 [Homalodisca vitripennis]|nr:hypothetical protein J6590_061003 [Homalodisca vitripennis]